MILSRLQTLTVLRDTLQTPVLHALRDCARAGARGEESYAAFAAQIYLEGGCLAEAVFRALRESENPAVKRAARGQDLPPSMRDALRRDLSILNEAASLTPQSLRAQMGLTSEDYPAWELPPSPPDIAGQYLSRLSHIERVGYGIFADSGMFYLDEARAIRPARSPDPVRLSDLFGYERERAAVLDNTRALLAGKSAANLLLTGDAGTGKSSTVKAVGNELFPEGLRILELRRDQLTALPSVLETLARNPLRFILFLDDLSFTHEDENFSTLKALLEGSVSARSRNVVIYATGNRRHLVAERFSDREGDEVHARDSMQELISLSERFGQRITFSRPDKAAYLDIVRRIADARGITLPREQLERGAEQFALQKGQRSPRAAKQYIEGLEM